MITKKVLIISIACIPMSYGNFKVQKFNLGKSLFFDKILSGNKNISCASCHNPLLGTSDRLSLGIGEGGTGLAMFRNAGKMNSRVHERVPRNSPHLFNLSDKDISFLFHDGRISKNKNYPSGILSPAKEDLPEGLESLLSAQALFPPTSNTEMAGQGVENDISKYAEEGKLFGENSVWGVLTRRIRSNREYVRMFKASFQDIKKATDIKEIHIANALGEYEKIAYRSKNSPYDQYMRGDMDALSEKQIKGMQVFNGKGRCIECHSGSNFTDNKFHSIALPSIGEGKGHGDKKIEDFGRMGVTNSLDDIYKFRTPSLRNLSLTGPYGHNGAYKSIKGIIEHHLNPKKGLRNYNLNKALLSQAEIFEGRDNIALTKIINTKIFNTCDLEVVELSNEEVGLLEDFLHSLTERKFVDASHLIPKSVPSGLDIHD